MNERKRIFDLVKQGVISTEEALVLLENIAKETGTRVSPSENDISEKEWFDSNSHDEESFATFAQEANDELTQLEELESKIDQINIQLIEINEALQLEESAELLQQKESLQAELDQLMEEKNELEARIDAKFYQKQNNQEMKDADDWKEQASETFTQVSDKLSDVTAQLGRFFKKSIKNVSQTVEDNIEWKELNIKVPGLAVTSFEHEFSYQETQPTILDFKLANGSIRFKTYDQDYIKIDAKIKIYGKFDESDPLAAVMKRSTIELTSDKLTYHLPNKRIKADLVVNLPEKTYDYVSARVLNGDIYYENLEGKDFFVKVTNGDVNFDNVLATMLEIEGTNGDVKLMNSKLNDVIIETVNGDIRIDNTPETARLSLINGDVKLSFSQNCLKALTVNTVNGEIKAALPNDAGYELNANTKFGTIQSRLENIELVSEINEKMDHQLSVRRVREENANISLTSKTGNIYIK